MIVDRLEEIGAIGPYEGPKPRTILVDRRNWERIAKEHNIIAH